MVFCFLFSTRKTSDQPPAIIRLDTDTIGRYSSLSKIHAIRQDRLGPGILQNLSREALLLPFVGKL